MISKKAIDDALLAHAEWRKRLQSAIDTGQSEFKVEAVKRDNACQFGQWLYNLSKEEKESENFQIVKTLHADFHKLAGEILEMASSGKKDEALKKMEFGNAYTTISGKLALALNAWKSKL